MDRLSMLTGLLGGDAEMQLQRRVELAEALLATHPIILVDMETERIVYVGGGVEFGIFAYVVGELVGKEIHMLVPERLRDRHREHFAAFRNDPHPRTMGRKLGILKGIRADGREIDVAIGLNAFAFSGKRYAIATVLDVTKILEGAGT